MTTKVGNSLRNVYPSVQDAKDDLSLRIGDKVETLRYYGNTPGGGATYTVVQGGTGNTVGGYYEDTDGGFQLEKILTETDSEHLQPDTPEQIAHRGFRTTSMENTMLAFTSALENGADSLEMDVCSTSDGELVVFHDTTVDALTTGTGTITNLTYAYLSGLKFDRLAGTDFADERIPLFTDVLTYAKKRGVHIYPEIKLVNSNADIDTMLQQIIDADMEELTTIQSFNLADLTYVRENNKKVGVAYLVSDTSSSAGTAAIDTISPYGKASLAWNKTGWLVNPTLVNYARSRNVEPVTYTVNDYGEAQALLASGVNKIMSDLNLFGSVK